MSLAKFAGLSARLATGAALLLASVPAHPQGVVPVCDEYKEKSGYWVAAGRTRKLLDEDKYTISVRHEPLLRLPDGSSADRLYVPLLEFDRYSPDSEWVISLSLPFLLTLADGREVNFDPDCASGEIDVDGKCVSPRLGLLAEVLRKGTSETTRLQPLEIGKGLEIDIGEIFLDDSAATEWLSAFSKGDAVRIMLVDIGGIIGDQPSVLLLWDTVLEGFNDALNRAKKFGDGQWGKLQRKECRAGDD